MPTATTSCTAISSPRTCWSTRKHRLWVADFGLARIRGDSDLTASGDVLGTLRYLSPEQAKGRREAIDGRSDVYALGATLYELLTLRPVCEGDDRAELLIKIVSDEPRFSRKLDAAIPLELKTIVLKALAKDPAERYATAGDLAADLTLFLADQPIQARPPTLVSRRTKLAGRHWKAVAAMGLMTVLMLVGIVGAALWSNARLRTVNERLERRSTGLTAMRAKRGSTPRPPNGTHAARSFDWLPRHSTPPSRSGPSRSCAISRSMPAANARGSFVWRYLWRRARREIVVLFGPTPAVHRDGTFARRKAPRHDRCQRGPSALGRRFRRLDSRHAGQSPG